jgi:ABC-type branched-subunit amino acid transport system substrate-binding protein
MAAFDALLATDVVAIIGPFLSGQTAANVEAVAAAGRVLISPSATAPELATTPPDDGFLFRTAPNDSVQVLAMAHYFEGLDPAVETLTIVHEEGSYGEGLAAALEATWVDDRGHALTGEPIAFPVDLAALEQTAIDAVWTSIADQAPTAVVVVGLGGDANVLVRTWLASGALPDLEWFFADAVKSSSFFGADATELPDAAEGMRGAAPTPPRTGTAFQHFVAAFMEGTDTDLSEEAYMPNTWDAVYVLAAALTQQSVDGEELGGTGLRDRLFDVSSGGQIFHAGQWRDMVSQIRDGNDVDYDGASGPCDFLPDGETISPYEVWELQKNDSGEWGFVQVDYFEAADLQGE